VIDGQLQFARAKPETVGDDLHAGCIENLSDLLGEPEGTLQLVEVIRGDFADLLKQRGSRRRSGLSLHF